MEQKRIYPVGIQDFEKLRQKGAIYVDKTDLIFQLVQKDYVFLSRPRRFGKSLLSSTLKYYFQGRKDLFQGLAIERMEKEWIEHPVLHFDLSTLKNVDIQLISSKLDGLLTNYEKIYGKNPVNVTPGDRLTHLITAAHKQTGKKTVVIIDEYDAPMQYTLNDDEYIPEECRFIQEFLMPLKACDADLHFAFITGLSPIYTDSILGGLNNFTDYSMQPEFASICGFTEDELITYFPMQTLLNDNAEKVGGYRFTSKGICVYNPYEVINAFEKNKTLTTWHIEPELVEELDSLLKESLDTIDSSCFYRPLWGNKTEILPLLYLKGYLTIKGYDREWNTYQLDIPNMNFKK